MVVFSVHYFFCLCTHDCVASQHNNQIVKYAEVTPIIGLINSHDESSYRTEAQNLVKWSEVNDLILNFSKTKEPIFDSRHEKTPHLLITINGTEVEMVSSFKFLGVTVSNDLS